MLPITRLISVAPLRNSFVFSLIWFVFGFQFVGSSSRPMGCNATPSIGNLWQDINCFLLPLLFPMICLLLDLAISCVRMSLISVILSLTMRTDPCNFKIIRVPTSVLSFFHDYSSSVSDMEPRIHSVLFLDQGGASPFQRW